MSENTNFTMQTLYSSKENFKILSGTINALEVETQDKKKVDCAIVYYNHIKILIPIHEMNIEQERKYLRNMLGAKIDFVILEIDKENNKLKVSAKELLEDPYKNIRIYFTEGGEYVGTITGYAPNGVYIKLMQGVDAAAIIPIWMNKSPNIGDSVAVRIYEIDVRKRKIYCSLLRVIKEKR